MGLWPVLLGALLLCGCAPKTSAPAAGEVVVYTSLDEPYSRPVLQAFERDTGIRVKPVYDLEAFKSRGLAERILAEAGRPRADVWWSSEVMQTLSLQERVALEPYRSPSAEGIPSQFRDPGGHWTGFAGRFRVLVYRRDRVAHPPRGLLELTASAWRSEVAMANPLFGTTNTEAVALFQVLGPERARAYYRERRQNGTRIVDGNSVAAVQAARGEVQVGQTDTDDAYLQQSQAGTVEVVFPDQKGMGALLIPNTAGLVRGGPHPEAARRFLDYLLRPETEMMLARLPSRQLPLHQSLQDRLPEPVRPLAGVKRMAVDYSRLRHNSREVDQFLRELFLQ
ncbi:MAG TPA: extracellular solute-binding protein [Armatimonadota bacterium]|nr:extracellular solute-binding protein [Armatimonadota bacterium]